MHCRTTSSVAPAKPLNRSGQSDCAAALATTKSRTSALTPPIILIHDCMGIGVMSVRFGHYTLGRGSSREAQCSSASDFLHASPVQDTGYEETKVVCRDVPQSYRSSACPSLPLGMAEICPRQCRSNFLGRCTGTEKRQRYRQVIVARVRETSRIMC